VKKFRALKPPKWAEKKKGLYTPHFKKEGPSKKGFNTPNASVVNGATPSQRILPLFLGIKGREKI